MEQVKTAAAVVGLLFAVVNGSVITFFAAAVLNQRRLEKKHKKFQENLSVESLTKYWEKHPNVRR